MVEQTAGFLNCFLLQLVGPKRKHLKVGILIVCFLNGEYYNSAHLDFFDTFRGIAGFVLWSGHCDDFSSVCNFLLVLVYVVICFVYVDIVICNSCRGLHAFPCSIHY